MKKKNVLFLCLVMILSFLLVACGGNKTSDSTELKVGEVATSDKIEFTLTKVDFVEVLDSKDEEYLLSVDYNTEKIVAEEGKVLVPFSFTVKYIGKEEAGLTIGEGMSLTYGDGYTFDNCSVCINQGGAWDKTYEKAGQSTRRGSANFQPLDPTVYECRGYFEVPLEVMENTSEPLKLEVPLSGETYSYVIR